MCWKCSVLSKGIGFRVQCEEHNDMVRCPYCDTEIMGDEIKCPFCGERLDLL